MKLLALIASLALAACAQQAPAPNLVLQAMKDGAANRDPHVAHVADCYFETLALGRERGGPPSDNEYDACMHAYGDNSD
jgi:hypothetical protein